MLATRPLFSYIMGKEVFYCVRQEKLIEIGFAAEDDL